MRKLDLNLFLNIFSDPQFKGISKQILSYFIEISATKLLRSSCAKDELYKNKIA